MAPIHVLHSYYLRASTIHEYLKVPKRYSLFSFFWKSSEQKNLEKLIGRLPISQKVKFNQLLTLQNSMHLLFTFYALLFVVAEGYLELGETDLKIDELLGNPNYDLLKRFRNGVFHFQKDFESDKILNFLEAQETEIWTQSLFKELGRFLIEKSEQAFESL
jgi:hypothetical protein